MLNGKIANNFQPNYLTLILLLIFLIISSYLWLSSVGTDVSNFQLSLVGIKSPMIGKTCQLIYENYPGKIQELIPKYNSCESNLFLSSFGVQVGISETTRKSCLNFTRELDEEAYKFKSESDFVIGLKLLFRQIDPSSDHSILTNKAEKTCFNPLNEEISNHFGLS
ncbi:MAG TPA: hypothetical protein VFF13_05955 [archaeon]|nr:hypothetical protein [archaeon]